MKNDLDILRLHVHVPLEFPEVKDDLQLNALSVLKAMVDLVAQQLTYTQTFAANLGFLCNFYSNNRPSCSYKNHEYIKFVR
jgi:hypothetical protein